MKTIAILGLVSFMGVAEARELPAQPRLQDAVYACVVKGQGKALKSGKRYTATFEDAGSVYGNTYVLVLSQDDGRRLFAQDQGQGFQVTNDNLTGRKSASADLRFVSDDYRRAEVTVSYPTRKGTLESDEFECLAAESPEIVESTPTLFTCSTDKPFNGRKNKFEFALAFIDHHRLITTVPFTEQDAEDEKSVHVKPKGSDLEALNFNTSVTRDRDRIEIRGDNAGIYLVSLVLYQDQNYQIGYVKTYSGDSKFKGAYSTVYCTRSDSL